MLCEAMEARDLRVAVIGGGPAGLACALSLQRLGASATVYEAAVGGSQGFGWLLMPNGCAALESLGAAKRVLGRAKSLARAEIHPFAEAGLPPPVTAEFELQETYALTRASIVTGLEAGLRPGTVVCAEAVAVAEKDGAIESVTLRRVGAPSSEFVLGARDVDLFVFADGIASIGAKVLNPSLDRKTRGRVHTLIAGVEADGGLASALAGRFLKSHFASPGDARRCAFGLLGVDADSVIGFLQFDTLVHGDAPRAAKDRRAWVEAALALDREGDGDNVALVRRFLGAWAAQDGVSDECSSHCWRPVASAQVDVQCRANAVVVGDAAHPMADFTSQGLSSALEDAVVLGDALDDSTAPLARRLAEFVAARRPEVAKVMAAGETMRDGFLRMATAPRDASAAALRPFTRSGTTVTKEEIAAMVYDTLDDGLATPAASNTTAERRRRFAMAGRAVASGDDGDTASEGEEDGVGLRELETHHTDKRKLFAAARQYSSSRSIHAEVVVGTGVRLDVLKRRAFNYRWATVPEGVLPLTAASSDYPAPPAVVAALQAHVEDAYFSYGPNEGLPEFREAAAAYFSDRVARGAAACGDAAAIGDRYDAALVCATNAAAAAIYAVAAATLRPGDECLVMAPVDFLLDRSVRAAGATVVRYDVRARGRRGDARPTFDVDELDRLATPRTRLLSVCNPHNPLGRAWTVDELRALAAFAERRDLAILSDEVWCDIVHAPRVHVPTAAVSRAARDRTFTVLGFSKSHALEGLRVGAVVAPTPESLARVLSATGTDTTANGCSVLSQTAAVAAMTSCGDPDHGWLGAWRRHLAAAVYHTVSRLNAMPKVSAALPEACFVVWADVSALLYAPGDETSPPREADLCDFLKDDFEVAVIPGLDAFFGPGSRGHLRLAVATSIPLLDQALDRLDAGLRAWAQR